jgi:serine/threonine protein kinase
VDASSPRWHRVTPSTFPWEDEAIDFLRNGISDSDPNRGWSNFEFVAGGVISEVDVFLLTRKGAFLVEIKSTQGRLTGDQQQWVFHKPDGGRRPIENPLLGANRKAKRLKSLLEYRWSKAAGERGPARPPFIQPIVFLSDPDLKVELTPDARAHVYGRDGSHITESGALPGIFEGVRQIGAAETNNPRFHQLDTATAVAVAKTLELIGIKESDHTRRVGSWLLRLDTVTERPGIQDFVADHERNPGVRRRIRIYSRQPQMSDEQATSLRLAADREFLVSDRVTHPNVVKAFERFDTDLGAAVVFEYEPTAVRLDQWLKTTEGIDLDDRMSVLRQLAETMRAVHRRKVTHRSLSPGSVLVRPGRTGEPRWVVLVTDFSLAGREHAGSSSTYLGTRTSSRTGMRFGLPSAAPGDVELLADESALLFCAPETATEDDPDGVSLDVFSFGAIAYEVLSGQAPGDSRESVREALRAGRGLQLAAVAPGMGDALCELVLEATRPLVSERLTSFDDVLAGLDLVEEELTTPTTTTVEPEAPADIDPLDARAGAVLGDGVVVKRRLGRGSTALALLVDRGEEATPREVVYKVSLGGDSDARLEAEAKTLSGLRHPGVIEVFGTTELGGRPVLIEAMAGTQSLADELRSNGTPSIEFLERWGSDLLDALRYLEREGRWHRDIKPDNLGVTEIGPNKEQHLVLFDFSLAAVPSTDLRAGTPTYLEPFLADRKTKQWDLQAERYAAAVTLYEMATGEVPRWGDGRSDPAFTTNEVVLDAPLFDSAARDPLEAFFSKALKRNPAERFGNAEEMLRAWQRVFEGLDVAGPALPHVAASTGESNRADVHVHGLPTTLAIGDPVISLGVGAKVVSALNRLGVSTVRQLADLVPIEVNRARRISPRIRRRIVELRAAVLTRFADELASAPLPTAVTAPPAATGTLAAGLATDDAPRLDLDRLMPLLVSATPGPGQNDTEQRAVRMLLGLEPAPGAEAADWASQTAIADAVGVTRGRLGQIAPKARAHWSTLTPLDSVRDEIVEMVAANGGVMAVREIEFLVSDSRGSGLPETDAARAAKAVVRAAIEAEEMDGSTSDSSAARLLVRRRGDRAIVAVDIDPTDQDTTGGSSALTGLGSGFDGQALAAYAANLGTRADELVTSQADVISQDRAVQALRSVKAPAGVTLSDGRLLRLAASCSQRVGVSSALELYPLNLDPVRALRLTRQSLAAAAELTVDEVRSRVQARFPHAQLPSRPELDRVLAEADVIVTWAGDRERFVRHGTVVGDLSSMTSVVSYHPTRFAPPAPGSSAPAALDVETASAQEVEDRLERSLQHGGFLALRVATSQGSAVRRGLQRFTAAPYDMVTVDLERWFLDELLASAKAVNVAWERLLTADLATEGTDFANLRRLTHEAARRLEERIPRVGPRVIAWNPGILATYDEINVIDRLRMQSGRANSDLQVLWLVVFGPTGEARPVVDGKPIPVEGPAEWLDLPTPWLRNLHREQLPASSLATLAKRTS